MNKRERLEKTIAGEQTDRVPAALWRHWPGDDQRAADLAYATLNFQKTYDWDFVTVMPANSFSIIDYGLQDHWEGSAEGTRKSAKYLINRSLDWTELRALDPHRGTLGRHMECLRLIETGLADSETPFIQTIYNPLTQARLIAGDDLVIRHMRTHPDRLQTGLNTITETTLRLIESLKQTAIAGIHYVIHHADYDLLSANEYQAFSLAYDRKILEALPSKWWLNIIRLGEKTPMFKFVDHYPVQAVNWQDQEAAPDLTLGKSQVRGAVCGGLSALTHLQYGTPTSIRDAVRNAIIQVNSRRIILTTGSPLLITSPLSNIRAVREAVNQAGTA